MSAAAAGVGALGGLANSMISTFAGPQQQEKAAEKYAGYNELMQEKFGNFQLGQNEKFLKWNMKKFEQEGLPGVLALGGGSIPSQNQHMSGSNSYRTTMFDPMGPKFSGSIAQNTFGAGNVF